MMLTIPPVLGSAAVVVLITWPASLLSLVVVMGIVPPGLAPVPPPPRLSARMSSGVLKVILFHWRRKTVASMRTVTMATQIVTRMVMVPKDHGVEPEARQFHSSWRRE